VKKGLLLLVFTIYFIPFVNADTSYYGNYVVFGYMYRYNWEHNSITAKDTNETGDISIGFGLSFILKYPLQISNSFEFSPIIDIDHEYLGIYTVIGGAVFREERYV
jgi:hypothetical protein